MSLAAKFDSSNHCVKPGWATYQRPMALTLRCRVLGHETDALVPQNDHCPAAYKRCRRCKTALRWFTLGTHRYGGKHVEATS